MNAWSPTNALQDGTHYWRVQVLDASNNVIATSSSRMFSQDTKPPTVTAKSPTNSAPLAGAFQATFSEPVVNVSGATFQVVIAGTSTTIAGSVSSTATAATFAPSLPLVPGQNYTARLTNGITDTAGNALPPYSWTVRADTNVENSSRALVETWDSDAATQASGGAYHAAATSGSSVTFTTPGPATNVSLLAPRLSAGGYADIYLDGVKKASNVSFYNSAAQWQRVVWSATGLANAVHSVQVRVLGAHPAGSSADWVLIDAFRVGTTLYQENSASVRDSFRRVNASAASGGSYDTIAHTTAGDNGGRPSYRLTFAGTGVLVFGVKSPSSGSVAVYLDGAKRATVNLNATTTQYQAVLFSASGLSATTHTIRVDVLGSTAGKNSSVGVDFVRIT
jgi:hypothetical protein